MELNPYAAHVYFNRANLYASLRKYKDSEDDYTRGNNTKLILIVKVPEVGNTADTPNPLGLHPY